MGINESSSHQVATLIVTLCKALFIFPQKKKKLSLKKRLRACIWCVEGRWLEIADFAQSSKGRGYMEKEVGDMERERERGGSAAAVSISLFLETGQAQAFSRPVNDAVLPSGRLLKATCYMSLHLLAEGWGASVAHVSTDGCHVAMMAIVGTHSRQTGLPRSCILMTYVQWRTLSAIKPRFKMLFHVFLLSPKELKWNWLHEITSLFSTSHSLQLLVFHGT